MRNDDGMTPLERELEMALGGLTPARTAIDRDRVMFRAGQASARRRRHLWQGVSATLAILLVVSVVANRPASEVPAPSKTVAQVPTPELPTNVASVPITQVEREAAEAFRRYMRTRRAVLEKGIEALPASPAFTRPTAEPPLTRDDLKDLLSST
jgi:hypothetical protein